MKVFLGGKVNELDGSWRDWLLGTELVHDGKSSFRKSPQWILYYEPNGGGPHFDSGGVVPWPIKERAVLNCHDYAGPYRQIDPSESTDSKYSGYFHGIEAFGCHGAMDSIGMQWVGQYCRTAIFQSDMVFTYINTIDCYGTIADLAWAAACGKYIYLIISKDARIEHDDYMYVSTFADQVYYYNGNIPEEEMIKERFNKASHFYIEWEDRNRHNPNAIQAYTPIQHELRQIEKWSADPRVRKSIQRLLERF